LNKADNLQTTQWMLDCWTGSDRKHVASSSNEACSREQLLTAGAIPETLAETTLVAKSTMGTSGVDTNNTFMFLQ
jgi:hypothetical protein